MIIFGFSMILIAAVAGGAFGLQYRVMRRYTVDNAALLSLFFATVVIPLILISIVLPGWTTVIKSVGFKANFLVYVFGFGWGLGAITYSYSFSILGMALAASILKGLTVAIGSGVPLIRHWDEVPSKAKAVTIFGIGVLLVGTWLAGKAGIMRDKDLKALPEGSITEPTASCVIKPTGKIFWIGLVICFFSGLLSACANLGYEFADPLQKEAVLLLGNAGQDPEKAKTIDLFATLIRWMPMYWGGITALLIFQGGSMLKQGTWRNYFAPGSGRDFLISSSMGGVHVLAQIPYGIGAFYLGKLGTTVGWGANIGMALIVASALGFMTGEWKDAAKASVRTLLSGIAVLIVAILILAYANSLV